MSNPSEPGAVHTFERDIGELHGALSVLHQSADRNTAELGAVREVVTGHTAELGAIRGAVDEHTTILADHSRQLLEHGRQLAEIRTEQQRQSATLTEMQSMLAEVVGIVRRMDAR
jgi:chromosome segregation ATPase